MVNAQTDSAPRLPLTPAVFHVLLALADGERHGYAIMQEVAASTGGQIKMGPGTLYGTLKRLLEAQLIEESDERPDPQMDDDRRRYYRLTGAGEQVVRAEASRYAEIVAIARGKKLIGKAALVSLPGGVHEAGALNPALLLSRTIYELLCGLIPRDIARSMAMRWLNCSATNAAMPAANLKPGDCGTLAAHPVGSGQYLHCGTARRMKQGKP